MFEHYFPYGIGKIWWETLIINRMIRHKLLGLMVQSLEKAMNLNGLSWLVHVLCMPTKRMPLYRL